MTRVSNTPVTRRRRKKILKKAKGYFGSKHKLFKTAKEQLLHSWSYAYRDRKQRKRNFRRLWITRLGNACAERKDLNLNYSRFIRLIKLAQIKLNRKQLSEMAIHRPQHFDALLTKIQNPW
ncbi:50S ribosomal protein L20 [endosymbiont GvMRE of Glomus versiforme]|uniref:50S ribosomal protein L20 n=1 Tax=endosymbiont GvMRE of Glomus versiforme TaxID=2039283 RepID=UPI000EE958D1|nr:50S ribosomal protein L20 [endosymbiont GvMRE of Glomus versiforme]RHZ35247.1 50S ribosomal protein L20 [endosymbiont GvMRE of Glomus versiforme]